MAPIRRYLRITKHSVLECRIYVDNPALAQSWLLNPRDPVLPRVVESVRPWVLPKLREERERARSKKKSSKRSIKDVVTTDEFEVSIFLTETDTRHSLVVKHKHFRDKLQTKLTSNSSRLMGATSAAPIDLDQDKDSPQPVTDVPILREESDEEDGPGGLDAIPVAGAEEDFQPHGEGEEDDLEMLVDDAGREEKKLAMDLSYEGFAIYGRVLCLMVKRRDGKRKQPMMEDWIASTQMPPGEELEP